MHVMHEISLFVVVMQLCNYAKVSIFRYADQVSVGDEVLVEGNDQLTPGQVIDIFDLTTKGDITNLQNSLQFLFCAIWLLHILISYI